MKTVIDAVNEFKGELNGAEGECCPEDIYLFYALDGSHYIFDDDKDTDGVYQYVCTRKEFLATVLGCETDFGKCNPINVSHYKLADKLLLTKNLDKELAMDIDWSKAPEGATHHVAYLKDGSMNEFVEYIKTEKSGEAYYSMTDGGHWSTYVEKDDNFTLTPRPQPTPIFTQEVNAITALYSFASWLTSMDKPITFSSNHWAAPAAEMVAEMISVNGMVGECDFDNIKVPSDFLFPVAIDSKTPIFTKEMANNGVLPSVGMECLLKNSGAWDFATVTVTTKQHIIFTLKDGREEVRDVNYYDCKPLTPPITLIDGKAYQFEARGNVFHGIYEKRIGSFNVMTGQFFNTISCTNIQPLTVEVK
tara:strand:- start:3974 stop:5059 length:1086 start_codon:yes stop_codon:yes gene_type:complete